MIKHLVFFNFKEEQNKNENINKALELLKTLPDTVPCIEELTCGRGIIRSERSYEIGLIVTFKNANDLNQYLVHPEHVKVSDFIVEHMDGAVSCDIEVN